LSYLAGAVSRQAAVAPTGGDVHELHSGWEAASAPPAVPGDARDPPQLDRLAWLPAQVPGTAAGVLRSAGQWRAGDGRDFDRDDWCFRLRFELDPAAPGEQLLLVMEGLATVAEVELNGRRVLESESMFIAHEVDVTDAVGERNELVIWCRALGPLLEVPRRPRARWRTRLVSERNLRFFRTMLLGRAPGFAPGPAAVGPWMPIRIERRRGVAVDELRLRSRLEAGEGRLAVRGRIRAPSGARAVRLAAIVLTGPTGAYREALELEPQPGGESILISGELSVPEVTPWWPHTHGAPSLYTAELLIDLESEQRIVPAGRVGFRSLESGGVVAEDGLQLRLNGVAVFARGAVWTPLDPALPASTGNRLRALLETVVDAGMNMLRVPGIGAYESDAFYDLCDELGILVWQDFMFANLDYPGQDPGFREAVQLEGRQVLGRLGGRPSLAVLCGGSEVAQQAAMMGLDPTRTGGALYEELLPRLIDEAEIRVPYVPSTPWGGDLPFRTNRGVANYYGVGAYLRPLEDARRSEVRFAAECLAFSNVPDEPALGELSSLGAQGGQHPLWKAGVPRDVGAEWDFEDVRDHYLQLLFGLNPVSLRCRDPERYLELSRHVTGEVMSEVLGEWRRADSPCAGALVLWLKDLRAGAGWGLLDHRGDPKVAYHHVRRALSEVAVWSTDEGLGGVLAHVANDGPRRVEAVLRVSLYRDLELQVEEVERPMLLDPHSILAENVESLLGRFVDVSWAYRFGPPAQDLIVLTLEDASRGILSQSFRLPAGRPTRREAPEDLAMRATFEHIDDRHACLTVAARRFLYEVRVLIPGFLPADDAFSVEPGRPRQVRLRRVGQGMHGPAIAAAPGGLGHVTALNLDGRVTVTAA
jgi:beta-mannosidase